MNNYKVFLPHNNIFFLRLSDNRRDVVVDTIALKAYNEIDILNKLLSNTTAPITAGFLRTNGFNDIVDEITYARRKWLNKIENEIKDEEIIDIGYLNTRMKALCIHNTQKDIDLSKYIEIGITESDCENYKNEFKNKIDKFNDLLNLINDYKTKNEMISIYQNDKIVNNYVLSTDVLISNRPYITIHSALCDNCVSLRKIYSSYEMPKWSISIGQDGVYKILKNRKTVNVEGLNSEEIVSQMFSLPQDFEKKAGIIKNQIKSLLSENISIEDVLYDWARDCYCLKKDTEEKIFSNFVTHESESQQYAKYTSLQTLIATLTSGKIRLNSIVTMNDKTEVNFLSDAAKNYKEDIEKEGDEYMFANKRFITSFTTRIDELDMWRFYGDNARGVCMVFEKRKECLEKIKDITYIGKENPQLDGIKKLLNNLNKEVIKFRIIIIDSNCPYLKPDDFKTEQEKRLLLEVNRPDNWYINSDSGIVTPYIERKISFNDKDMGEDYFPLKLKSIILGPEMEQMDINKYQIGYLLQKHSLWSIDISKSKITSYR